MMAGQLFTMYVQDSPAGSTGAGVTGHIEPDTLVWYVPSSENGLSTGAFYYAPKAQGKNGRDENKKVALKFLTSEHTDTLAAANEDRTALASGSLLVLYMLSSVRFCADSDVFVGPCITRH